MLDTNAKRTLWPYIIQILPEEEQEVCKRKVIYLIDRHAAGKSVSMEHCKLEKLNKLCL